MSILTAEARFRQRVIKYSLKNGVTKASIRFHRSRQAIYEWRAKYDGKSWKSLVDKSHRTNHHPNEHTEEEKQMILRRYPRYKKVERQHRCDELRFYKKMRMYNLEDGREQLRKYNIKSNNIPKI